MRRISVPIYLAAFVISALIFAVGVYVGTVVDEAVKGSIGDDLERVSERVTASGLLVLLEDSPSFCPVYLDELDKLDEETERIGYKLAYAEDVRGVHDTELKKEYFLLEAQAYFLSKKVGEHCEDGSTLVLYFYSNAECEECAGQGKELDEARGEVEGLKVYSFDGGLESPIAEALEDKYGVDSYPSLVIGEKKYSGPIPSEQIVRIAGEGQ